MKADIHPNYQEAEIRCACGNSIKTRSIKKTTIIGICNSCHPFYTGQQKFVDTAGRVDKFQQRMAKTQAAQAAAPAPRKKKKKRALWQTARMVESSTIRAVSFCAGAPNSCQLRRISGANP